MVGAVGVQHERTVLPRDRLTDIRDVSRVATCATRATVAKDTGCAARTTRAAAAVKEAGVAACAASTTTARSRTTGAAGHIPGVKAENRQGEVSACAIVGQDIARDDLIAGFDCRGIPNGMRNVSSVTWTFKA